MDIQREIQDGQARLTASGKLDTTTAPVLEDAVRQCFEEGARGLLIDMAGVPYVSSAGLRVLLAAHKQCAARGNCLCLRNVGEMAAEVFELTGFDTVFTILPGEG